MIQVSAQYGEPKAADRVWPLHRELNELFDKCLSRAYFRTLQKLSIVLRVSGTIWAFGGEGPERLKYLPKDSEITVDLVIPEKRWKDATAEALRQYMAVSVQKAVEMLIACARQKGEIVKEQAFADDVGKAMAAFRTGVGGDA